MIREHFAATMRLAGLVGLVLVATSHQLEAQRFFGKYRGTVVNVDDPSALGRIQATIPDVLGAATSEWALPALPFAGVGHGLLLLPELGDNVWIEFEGGDAARPIWTGTWFSTPLPTPDPATMRVLVTSQGHRIRVDDAAGQIELAHAGGNAIRVTDEEISLSVGRTTLVVRSEGLYVNGKRLTRTK